METLSRLLKAPSVADYVQWCGRHGVRPPNDKARIKLQETSGFRDAGAPWKTRRSKAWKT